jgi:uncharacterized transporter YbjL
MSRLPKTDELIIRTFAKVDAIALGIACGIVTSGAVFIATVVLLLKGGMQVGRNLSLLSQYFMGYSVTWSGAVIGAVYGLFLGFVIGWILAFVRNVTVSSYLHAIRLWANLSANHFLDRFDS